MSALSRKTFNIITAVPTTSETGNIDIKPGFYFVSFYGTQAAATTDPTLALSVYSSAAQSQVSGIWTALDTDTTYALTVDLELGQTGFHAVCAPVAQPLAGWMPIYIPHGLKWTYTKNGGTAVDITVVLIPAALGD